MLYPQNTHIFKKKSFYNNYFTIIGSLCNSMYFMFLKAASPRLRQTARGIQSTKKVRNAP